MFCFRTWNNRRGAVASSGAPRAALSSTPPPRLSFIVRRQPTRRGADGRSSASCARPVRPWGLLAGDLGGCPPRPPTEPDVPVKGIRLVTLWCCPSHVPSPYQDTLVRLGVLGVGLASGPQRGTPFAPQGPVGPVPPLRRYYGALRLPDSLLAALRFLRLEIPWSVCISSPFGRRRVANGSSRSLLYRLLPIRFSSGNCQDLPRSRKTRAIIRHVPPTPV